MTELFFWPTPNGYKILIAIEEFNIPCKVTPIDITKGEQHLNKFRNISPFGLIPVLVDKIDSGEEVKIFESGAILQFLAEKTNLLMPENKWQCLSWLFWQVSGLGPAAGQNHHFHHYAPVEIQAAKDRFKNETIRLYKVLDTHLQSQKSGFISGRYSISDIACFPWINNHKKQGIETLDEYPSLKTWYNNIYERKAVRHAYKKVENIVKPIVLNSETMKTLFNNSSTSPF